MNKIGLYIVLPSALDKDYTNYRLSSLNLLWRFSSFLYSKYNPVLVNNLSEASVVVCEKIFADEYSDCLNSWQKMHKKPIFVIDTDKNPMSGYYLNNIREVQNEN